MNWKTFTPFAFVLLASCGSEGANPSDDAPDADQSSTLPANAARDGGLDASAASEPAMDGGAQVDASSTTRRDAGPVDAGVRFDSGVRSDAGMSRDDDDASLRPSGDASTAPPSCSAGKGTPAALALRGDLGAHDPVIIQSEGQYFVFVTGRGIPTKRSTDLLNWQRGSAVFAQNPTWIAQQVPGATDMWAPDISQFGGAFHLYYSVSTFGSNRSCIGHATRASLTAGNWQDRGSVICSNAGGSKDDWNAIDPNVALDEAGTPWLSFGSFWSGIKQIKLTLEGTRADMTLGAIAGRNGGAIEAPFIIRHCSEYYLFVSFDVCCKGADSTYRIMVGRSRAITGPYVDKSGMALTRGGGTQILAADVRWRGPGHNAVLQTSEGDYNVYHAYAAGDGHSELRISDLVWDDAGWPVSGGP